MFQLSFWKDAAERALKTAAQALLLAFGATTGPVNLYEWDWAVGGGAAAAGAVISLLTSIASAPFGNRGDASLVPSD